MQIKVLNKFKTFRDFKLLKITDIIEKLNRLNRLDRNFDFIKTNTFFMFKTKLKINKINIFDMFKERMLKLIRINIIKNNIKLNKFKENYKIIIKKYNKFMKKIKLNNNLYYINNCLKIISKYKSKIINIKLKLDKYKYKNIKEKNIINKINYIEKTINKKKIRLNIIKFKEKSKKSIIKLIKEKENYRNIKNIKIFNSLIFKNKISKFKHILSRFNSTNLISRDSGIVKFKPTYLYKSSNIKKVIKKFYKKRRFNYYAPVNNILFGKCGYIRKFRTSDIFSFNSQSLLHIGIKCNVEESRLFNNLSLFIYKKFIKSIVYNLSMITNYILRRSVFKIYLVSNNKSYIYDLQILLYNLIYLISYKPKK